MSSPFLAIIGGDCLKIMELQKEKYVDLVFADPPFNIGFPYPLSEDNLSRGEYISWSRRWMKAVHRILKDNGTFWLAIGDEYVSDLKHVAESERFTIRNWIIWHYTFGVHCTNKFSRSHTHLLYFVKNPREFTFNADAIRVPSARQTIYKDKMANPQGRVPPDTWTYPRIAGTHKERRPGLCPQMPEQILGRIIRACSNLGDLVFDPFAGTGTTLAVAKKLGRAFLGIEIDPGYLQNIRRRLNGCHRGDPLLGTKNPYNPRKKP